MATYSYGLLSAKDSAITPATGLPALLADIGKIYRDSAEFTQEDAGKTEHFSELDDDPIVSISRKGLKSIRLRLMDTSASNCVKWLGGTLVEILDEPDQWEEAEGTPRIERAFEFEMEDGSSYGIRRGMVDAKLMPDPKRAGFTVIDLMISVLKPLVDGVKSTYKKDAPAA